MERLQKTDRKHVTMYWKGGKLAGTIAKEAGFPVGEIGCPHCGITFSGAIWSPDCPLCGKNMFLKVVI